MWGWCVVEHGCVSTEHHWGVRARVQLGGRSSSGGVHGARRRRSQGHGGGGVHGARCAVARLRLRRSLKQDRTKFEAGYD